MIIYLPVKYRNRNKWRAVNLGTHVYASLFGECV